MKKKSEPKLKLVHFRTSAAELAKIKQAAKEHKTVSDFIRTAIVQYLTKVQN